MKGSVNIDYVCLVYCVIKVDISLFILCLDYLAIAVNGVLRSPNRTVFLSVSPFSVVSICFIYLGVFQLGMYILINAVSF